jgi:hypothetical protein
MANPLPTGSHPTGAPSGGETFNPWSVVNLVFSHLASKGLHPVLGETGDPAVPAADLLRALGIEPGPERSEHVRQDVSQQLAELRVAMLGEPPDPEPKG